MNVNFKLSNEEYHAHDNLSRTDLLNFFRGYERYEYSLDHCEQKDEFDIGTAFHMAILEPNRYRSEVVAYDGIRRGKEWDKFSGENAGRLILKQSDYDIVKGMINSLWDNPIAGNIVDESIHEVSIFWEDKATELSLKIRPDILLPNKSGIPGLVADLKTTAAGGADANDFRRTIELQGYGYDLQAYLYLEGSNCAKEFGFIRDFVWIVVEKTPPYIVEIYQASPEYLVAGDIHFREIAKEYKRYTEDRAKYIEEAKRIKMLEPSFWYTKRVKSAEGE